MKGNFKMLAETGVSRTSTLTFSLRSCGAAKVSTCLMCSKQFSILFSKSVNNTYFLNKWWQQIYTNLFDRLVAFHITIMNIVLKVKLIIQKFTYCVGIYIFFCCISMKKTKNDIYRSKQVGDPEARRCVFLYARNGEYMTLPCVHN